MLSKTALFAGVAGVAALGLIGGGSYAAFTTSASVTQTISSGTLEVSLTGGGATANASTSSPGTLTLPSESNLVPGQQFIDTIQIKNIGTVNAQLTSLSFNGGSLSGADEALASDLTASATLSSSTVSGFLSPVTLPTIGPGYVPGGPSGSFSLPGGGVTLAPGDNITATITVNFVSASNNNDAAGATFSPTLTVDVSSLPVAP